LRLARAIPFICRSRLTSVSKAANTAGMSKERAPRRGRAIDGLLEHAQVYARLLDRSPPDR
jgi:hypothetical protein